MLKLLPCSFLIPNPFDVDKIKSSKTKMDRTKDWIRVLAILQTGSPMISKPAITRSINTKQARQISDIITQNEKYLEELKKL